MRFLVLFFGKGVSFTAFGSLWKMVEQKEIFCFFDDHPNDALHHSKIHIRSSCLGFKRDV